MSRQRELEYTLLKKGGRVAELTKKTGQRPREGIVIDIRGDTLEIRWDDGHVSSLSGGFLRPIEEEKKAKPE